MRGNKLLVQYHKGKTLRGGKDMAQHDRGDKGVSQKYKGNIERG